MNRYLQTYTMDDKESLTLTPRSYFYALEPIGIGTPYSESMTSYIERLAKAHCTNGKSVIQECANRSKRPIYLLSNSKLISNSYFYAYATINSTKNWVKSLTQTLGYLTCQNNLQFLTMLPWANVISARNLVKKQKAWCPLCYEMWRQTNQPIYEPLIWAVQVVKICSRHQIFLTDRCPNEKCQKKQLFLNSKFGLGFCYKCGNWLGENKAPTKINQDSWEVIAEKTTKELVAHAPKLPSFPNHKNLVLAVQSIKERIKDDNEVFGGLVVNVKIGFAHFKWQRGESLPEMNNWLKVASILFKSPLEILTNARPTEYIDWGFAEEPPSKKYKRVVNKSFARDALIKELRSSSPKSLHKLEISLNYSQNSLRHHFPALSKKLSAHYLYIRKHQRAEEAQRLRLLIKKIVSDLQVNGVYPSSALVRKILQENSHIKNHRGNLCNPILILDEVMLEAGILKKRA